MLKPTLLVVTALVTTAVAQAAAPLAPNHLVLNEVVANPLGTDLGNEWIEIYNPTPFDVDLAGWTVTDRDTGASGGTDGLSGIVPAFGHLVVTLKAPRLANTADDVALVAPDGLVVDEIAWGGTSGRAAAPEGHALARWHLLSPTGPALGSEDEWHVTATPTPGAANAAWTP
ncbi:MAG TPA: lamin tail domain-containing protein [Candidatus Thermoplasmatota archaeon]|nr:lamin tail domain-containing protein [Candidatus Thermoplasmatota archaeon]